MQDAVAPVEDVPTSDWAAQIKAAREACSELRTQKTAVDRQRQLALDEHNTLASQTNKVLRSTDGKRAKLKVRWSVRKFLERRTKREPPARPTPARMQSTTQARYETLTKKSKKLQAAPPAAETKRRNIHSARRLAAATPAADTESTRTTSGRPCPATARASPSTATWTTATTPLATSPPTRTEVLGYQQDLP